MSDYEKVFRAAAELLFRTVGMKEDEIRPETVLFGAESVDDEGIEPVDMARFVMACEKKFDIVIHDEDVHTFVCFEDGVRYIARVLAEGGQSVAVATDEERVAWYYQ